MQTQEFLSGHSDLLRQFKDRTGTTTEIENLKVIFHFEDNNLGLVESDGEASMVIAIFNPENKCWQHELIPGSSGRRMVEHFCELYDAKDVSLKLNAAFESPRRLF